MDRYDEEAEQRSAAVVEVAARLRTRGITVTGAERPEELADLLSAVERFEATVEAHGGDLMVDDLKSVQPDDSHFVVPRRGARETVRAYIGRIDEAAALLRRRPPPSTAHSGRTRSPSDWWARGARPTRSAPRPVASQPVRSRASRG